MYIFERIYRWRSIWTQKILTQKFLYENFLRENFLDEIKANYGSAFMVAYRMQFVDLAFFVIGDIYPLLLTSWRSLVHKLCMYSSKMKRLVLGLLVNGVRI